MVNIYSTPIEIHFSIIWKHSLTTSQSVSISSPFPRKCFKQTHWPLHYCGLCTFYKLYLHSIYSTAMANSTHRFQPWQTAHTAFCLDKGRRCNIVQYLQWILVRVDSNTVVRQNHWSPSLLLCARTHTHTHTHKVCLRRGWRAEFELTGWAPMHCSLAQCACVCVRVCVFERP